MPTHKSILRFLRRFFLFFSFLVVVCFFLFSCLLVWRGDFVLCFFFVLWCLRLLGLAKETPSPLPSIVGSEASAEIEHEHDEGA